MGSPGGDGGAVRRTRGSRSGTKSRGMGIGVMTVGEGSDDTRRHWRWRTASMLAGVRSSREYF